VHRQNVRVLQTGAEPDLAKEALGAQHPGQLRVKNLEGHRPVVFQISSQVESRHATVSELLLDEVVTFQRA
jgi:hypothetical protein